MVKALSQMLAPTLVFTADEAWEFVPGKTAGSVHELVWQPTALARSEAEREVWKAMFTLRELVLPSLEKARQAKQIGKALDAKVTLEGTGPELALVKPELEALRELLNVSQLEIRLAGAETTTVSVGKAAGEKCERCWHWETDVGSSAEHPTICGRCVRAITQST
jgi:isoleucyl-tRNA synthetase